MHALSDVKLWLTAMDTLENTKKLIGTYEKYVPGLEGLSERAKSTYDYVDTRINTIWLSKSTKNIIKTFVAELKECVKNL